MRETLSKLLVDAAANDDRFVVLSGDHGYALFDSLRATHGTRFVNVGVAEQNMIGVAAGLTKVGFRPCVYGLAAFIPIRVLEQIKLDLCHANFPVILLGDGAGLVYSTLGVSHQCGEDISCLRPLPNIAIYSPCDAFELQACWSEARQADHPCYIRIGKADRPPVHDAPIQGTAPLWITNKDAGARERLIIATGSMSSLVATIALTRNIPCLSVPRIKPLHSSLLDTLQAYRHVAVVEEHTSAGGLYSALAEAIASFAPQVSRPQVLHFGLSSRFTASAGSYDHALSEHALDDGTLTRRLINWMGTT